MKLFLVRHAIAEDALPGQSDAARPLSAKGRERFAERVRALRRSGVRFERLHFSPARRALETAELLAPLVEGELRVDAHLAAPPGAALLAGLEGARVALVGHEPWLTQLAAWLLPAGEPRLVLGKGGVIELEGELAQGAMRLVHAD